jgi:transposase InsO family protein
VLLGEGQTPPPIRTIAAILRRHGCVEAPSQTLAPPPQRFQRDAPNQLWQLDFKGPLEVARQRVLPLSVLDDHSRYLLTLRPCTDMTFATVQGVLWELFGDVGLPEAMLCDNAFAAKNSRVGLSSFDGWLVRLGIKPVHGRPYHPQTQGKIERFHGTLERELWPKARRDSMPHFRDDLEAWRPIYNTIRPHEALGDQPPVRHWQPSARPRPERIPEVVYPAGALLRTVCPVGTIRYHRCRIMVGRGLAGERIRIEESAHEVSVYYCEHRVRCLASGQLDTHHVV